MFDRGQLIRDGAIFLSIYYCASATWFYQLGEIGLLAYLGALVLLPPSVVAALREGRKFRLTLPRSEA